MAIELPIWIYWLTCGLAAAVMLIYRRSIPALLSPALRSSQGRKGYSLAIALGWLVTLLAAIAYVLFTRKEVEGAYQIQDLSVFSLLNGTLEQFMFVFWFLLGCFLARRGGIKASWKVFGWGFLSYSIFSGLIHGVFWVAVLPSHEAIGPLRASLLLSMSIGWLWLFWRYYAIAAIVAMHIAIDFFMIGHLHFPWFEPYQLL